jgi:hypothetical protein
LLRTKHDNQDLEFWTAFEIVIVVGEHNGGSIKITTSSTRWTNSYSSATASRSKHLRKIAEQFLVLL